MSEHVIPKSTYLAVYVALMVLLFLTLGAAYIDLDPMNYAVSLSIAVAKAVLIVLFFMHVRYGPRLTGLFAVAAYLWLAILIAISLGDYFTRDMLSILGK